MVVGTTGESPTVNVEEHCELIKVAVDHVAGRIPVIAGTGGNSTAEAIELTEFAKKAGADMSLSVVPYYNQADPGRHVSPFQGDRRSCRTADPALQRTGPYRRRYVQRHHPAPRPRCLASSASRTRPATLDRACDLIARARRVRPCTPATT